MAEGKAKKKTEKSKKTKKSKKLSVTVETFAVRQVAVNLVTVDRADPCPQSTWNQYDRMLLATCPDPSVLCPRVTISGYVALVGVPPLSPENLTTLLNGLDPVTPFKKMTLTVLASKAKHTETVKAIKKAQ